MQAGRALTLAPLSAPERDARLKGEAPEGAEQLLSGGVEGEVPRGSAQPARGETRILMPYGSVPVAP